MTEQATTMDDEILVTIRSVLEGVQLLPKAFAAYQPLVVDALVSFFARLTPAHLTEIVTAQALLDPAASPDDRLIALLRECPTLHKLGQVISHDRGLPAALRERLQGLESMPPAMEPAELIALVRAEVGEVPGLTIAGEALAEGSVATIVPFEWDEAGARRRGVFKVLKPKAETRMREELAVWPELSDYLEQRSLLQREDFVKSDELVVCESTERLS